jgi:peptidoglycan/LPS O-acetylase OafA/YrhL
VVTIDQRAVGRDNNFNLLRMAAATAVLVSHAWPIVLGKGTPEPLEALTGYKLGTTAVTIFFAVSGFFITKSFHNRHSLADFTLARVARIYPGLFVVLMLTAFGLGPFFTALPITAYFADIHSWAYVPINLALWRQMWSLPGVFLTNPYGTAINGSLWTLFHEVICYALVVLFTLVGLCRQRTYPIVLAGAVAAALLIPPGAGIGILRFAAPLALPFALGAGAYIYRQWVPLTPVAVLGLVLLAAVGFGTPLYPVLHATAVSYAALWFGFADLPGLRAYNRFGDYSYGMYIYDFRSSNP